MVDGDPWRDLAAELVAANDVDEIADRLSNHESVSESYLRVQRALRQYVGRRLGQDIVRQLTSGGGVLYGMSTHQPLERGQYSQAHYTNHIPQSGDAAYAVEFTSQENFRVKMTLEVLDVRVQEKKP